MRPPASMPTLSLKLLDRYILKQLLDYFLLGVVIFTFIAFFSNTFLTFMQDTQRLGISFGTTLTLMGLQLPKIIALILPASTFLAVLMVFNTLNSNFEIIAIRMNGISLNRLILAAVLLGLSTSGLSYLLGDYLVPYCNKQAQLLKQHAIQQGNLPIGQDSFMFKDYDSHHRLRQMIYVGKYNGQNLKDSTIVDLTKPHTLQVVQAKSGTWYPDRWEFNNANAYTVSKNKDLMIFNHFSTFVLRNLIQHDSDTEAKESELEAQQRKAAGIDIDSDTQPFFSLWNTIEKREALGKRVAKITYIRLWEKITLPLSCLAILLTAVPLAITPPRSRSNRGFVYAIGVLFLYYVLRSIAAALGRSGLFTLGGLISTPVSLMFAAWLPLLVISGLGGFLLARKSKVL